MYWEQKSCAPASRDQALFEGECGTLVRNSACANSAEKEDQLHGLKNREDNASGRA
jgi:hypothetical protein